MEIEKERMPTQNESVLSLDIGKIRSHQTSNAVWTSACVKMDIFVHH